MNPHCGHELEDSIAIFSHNTSAHYTSPCQVWWKSFNSWEDIQTLTECFFYLCTDLEYSIPIFLQDTQFMMMYHKTKFGCKRSNSSEDIIETVIFWSYEPMLWPWPWRQQPNLLLLITDWDENINTACAPTSTYSHDNSNPCRAERRHWVMRHSLGGISIHLSLLSL